MAKKDAFVVKREATSNARIAAQASRSLHLLSAIENTIEGVETDARLMANLAEEARRILETLDGSTPGLVDPDGRTGDLLSKGAAAARRLYDFAIRKRQAARDDPQLTGEDGVVEAYDAYIAAAADLHNMLEDLRDTLETIDSLQSPSTGKQYTSVEDLLADLRA